MKEAIALCPGKELGSWNLETLDYFLSHKLYYTVLHPQCILSPSPLNFLQNEEANKFILEISRSQTLL